MRQFGQVFNGFYPTKNGNLPSGYVKIAIENDHL